MEHTANNRKAKYYELTAAGRKQLAEQTNSWDRLESAIWSVNRDQAITDVKTLEQIKSESTAGSRFIMLVLAGFAGLALLLAAIGIYGVVAYSVTQRTREMGIRSALGATKVQLLALALRSSILLTGIGLAVGALGILASRTLVASLLFDTRPAEPATLLAVAGPMSLVTLVASAVPARRAAAIDPSVRRQLLLRIVLPHQ